MNLGLQTDCKEPVSILRGVDLNHRPLGYEPNERTVNQPITPTENNAVSSNEPHSGLQSDYKNRPKVGPVRTARGDEIRAYKRRWQAARRAAFFANHSCIECGSTERLILHHRNPKEKEDSRIWAWSTARREAEIAKCDVVCEACHKAIHAKWLRESVAHGGLTMYINYGCRCDQCKAAKLEYGRKWEAANAGCRERQKLNP